MEDDPDISGLVEGRLARDGGLVETAATAAESLERLKAGAPDLVLLDLGLPDDSGFNVCRRMRDSLGPEVPILFMTVQQDMRTRLAGFRAGAQDFIPKPFFLEELAARVRVHLEARRARQALAERNLALRQRDQARRDMVDMIVHDLKQPLTTIGGSLKFIEESPELDGTARDLLHCSERAQELLLRMIDDILDVEKAEEAGLKARREPVRVERLLRDLSDLFAPSCARRRIRLKTSFQPAGLVVAADRTLLLRALANLVSNALKHTQAGGEVVVDCSAAAGSARLSVSDRGLGIPDADKESVFGKFVRLSEEGEPAGRNDGIGLYFCRKAAEAMGGSIRVEDRDGGGSRFVMELKG